MFGPIICMIYDLILNKYAVRDAYLCATPPKKKACLNDEFQLNASPSLTVSSPSFLLICVADEAVRVSPPCGIMLCSHSQEPSS